MKISKVKLAEVINAKKTKLDAQFALEQAEYVAAFAQVQAKIVTALQEATKAAKSAREYAHLSFLRHDTYGHGIAVVINADLPKKPEKPYQLQYMERDLRRLEMCVDESISINANDSFHSYI